MSHGWFNDPFQKSKIAYKNNFFSFFFMWVHVLHCCMFDTFEHPETFCPECFFFFFSFSFVFFAGPLLIYTPHPHPSPPSVISLPCCGPYPALALISVLIYEMLMQDMGPHSNISGHAYQNYPAVLSQLLWLKTTRRKTEQKHMIRCLLSRRSEKRRRGVVFLFLSLALTCLNSERVQVCSLFVVSK